jgi:hypothetical protein
MRKSPLFIGMLSLTAALIIGCNDSKSTRTLIDTKALYEISASDKLIIHIEDGADDSSENQLNETTDSNNTSPMPNITANGQTDFVKVHVGEPVFFSSEGSVDQDGEIVKYIWTDMDNNVLSTDPDFTRIFYAPAVYEKTLTVVDDKNGIAQQRICILADIEKEDIPLIAHTGPDIVTRANLPVVVEGRAICKTGNFSYEWREGDNILANTQRLGYLFDEWVHYVTFKITDNDTGMYAMHTMKITVKPALETE